MRSHLLSNEMQGGLGLPDDATPRLQAYFMLAGVHLRKGRKEIERGEEFVFKESCVTSLRNHTEATLSKRDSVIFQIYQHTVKLRYSAPAFNIIPPIEHTNSDPKNYFHSYLHISNSENFGMEHTSLLKCVLA